MNNEIIVIIKNNKEEATVKKNLLCLETKSIDRIDSNCKCINKRYFSPQCTDKNKSVGLGLSFSGIRHILVSFGFNVHEVEDVIDKYDKSDIFFISKSNGRDSVYIDMKSAEIVVKDILSILDPTNDIVKLDELMAIMYQGCIEKSDYIINRIGKKSSEQTIESECKQVISKYNVLNNKLYGGQQYNIRREISEILNENLSFSQCLKKLNIGYKWVGEQPYFNGQYGKQWLVCELS